jgi:pimeloyl-ACP methyl ester carboxylesterase
MSELGEKLHEIHDSLDSAGIAHAFGGAIALAYCVEEPRGTRDLDVNIFLVSTRAAIALGALPDGVRVSEEDIAAVERDGQTRLFWDGVPVDVFLNNLPLHDAVAASVVWVPMEGREVPMLDCASLAMFKAFLDRTRDWADLEAIALATPEDIEEAAATIADLVGEDDPGYARLRSLLEARPR